MTLNQLYYFQTIATLQHFHKAAIKLNISQPSLSRSISNLEEELGLYLFEKSGRNIVLTKYGTLFLEHVNRILEEIEIAEKKIKQLASTTNGHIDIAYVSPLAGNYIPKSVRQFLNQKGNTNVTFTFTQQFTSKMVEGLKNDKFDVIFGSYVANEPSIQFVPIMRQEMVVIVPLNHPLSLYESISIEEIEPYPLIAYDRYSGLGKYTKDIFEKYNLKFNIICEASDEYALAALVAEQFGVSFLANVPAITQVPVKILSLSNEKIYHTVYMMYCKNKYLSPAAQNFISFIRNQDL